MRKINLTPDVIESTNVDHHIELLQRSIEDGVDLGHRGVHILALVESLEENIRNLKQLKISISCALSAEMTCTTIWSERIETLIEQTACLITKSRKLID